MALGFTVLMIVAALVLGGIYLLIRMHEKGMSVDWGYLFEWFRNR
jgi:hypothetical protein